MGCVSCRQRYEARKAARAAKAAATNGSAPRVRPQAWRRGIMKKPVVQVQPEKASITINPHEGVKDPSTGQLRSVIKEGTAEPGKDGKPMDTTVHITTELEKGYPEPK